MSGDIRKWFLKPHTKPDSSKEATVTAKRPSEDTATGPSPKKPKSAQKDSESAVDKELKVRAKAEKKTSTGGGKGRGKADTAPAENADLGDGGVEAKKPAGRGRGAGKSDGPKPTGGRGRGRGAYFNAPRATPPHKGEKDVPEGAENALAGLTFVISGTLDSLEREEAEDLIKRHGGRVTSAVSKKTSFLLADEDIGGQKSQKAKDIGIPFLSEDGLFDKIRASKPKAEASSPSVKSTETEKKPQVSAPSISKTHTAATKTPPKPPATASASEVTETDTWPHKHRPTSTNDIIANQSIVKQLKDWLLQWDAHHLQGTQKGGKGGKGKKATTSSNNDKKAAMLSGPPGIGKTTTARLLCEELGYDALEVNASDSRGKADTKLQKGVGASIPNAVKEMVSNASLGFGSSNSGQSTKKSVLIMDEVDGMSAGDRGGVADLIATIKISKIPIICICNDRYSQKIKSLMNYCLQLSYRKPTKQQMAKRLQQIARSEGLNIDEIALEELADRTHGDMRLALNQLQYMSLHSKVLKYADIKSYSTASGKDEDISPFSAVDKLMGYDGSKLRIDERLDLAMSDLDLVPLLIQENYLNYCPSGIGRDDDGTKRMDRLAQAAASISDADIVNVQIRRYRQWQHSQTSAFMSTIIPASLMHGRRETLTQGERNFNRFGAWLGKNSTFGKNTRLLEDVHVHMLASRVCEPTRESVRLDYAPILVSELTEPLRTMDKSDAVEKVLDLMEEYSLTQEDYDSLLDTSKFQGRPNPLEGIPAPVKAALTRGYSQRLQERRVRSSDLLPSLPGQKKSSKKSSRVQEDELPTEGLDDLPEDGEGEGAEKDDDSQEEDDSEQGLELLKSSKAGYEINVAAGETPKSTGKRKAPSKSIAAKGASTSKQAKRKK